MAEFTENYSLIKPSEADYYDVQDFNENMDAIDTLMAAAETATNEISEKIGTAEDTGSETVFGKLNALATESTGSGLTAIKSIQRVTLTLTVYNGSAEQSINTVVPENCIVLMQYWNDTTNGEPYMTYTLTANKISVVTTSNAGGTITVHFQIVEFC